MGGLHSKLWILLFVVALADLSLSHVHGPGCSHHGHDHHDHHQQFSPAHGHRETQESNRFMLPEELAEEEDLRLYGFQSFHGGHHHHDHAEGFSELTGVGLWVRALGCSLLVSMASLICLILLPLMFSKGKPSKAVVDALALFGAGAMLGDAFLHQLPHAFGGEHSHNHGDMEHGHDHGQSHSHSLKDLSVGLSVLGGIVLFLLVEKIVRYVDDHTGGDSSAAHGHHHHHHHTKKSDAQTENSIENNSKLPSETADEINGTTSDMSSENKVDSVADVPEKKQPDNFVRKRKTSNDGDEKIELDKTLKAKGGNKAVDSDEAKAQAPSNLVFGYLNLFSDGVHNFTDGVALGSAFLLYGSVGGWSRTLFLLAHELPQEIGDFGILVRSGFSVSKALFFNFLSALVALVGTALALLLGQDPGQSSLIEAFTAGGFIYIAVAGVLAEMNSSSSTSIKTTIAHLTFLVMGMGVALCISLVE